MQNKITAAKPWYKACSRCGKEVFSDLLDAEGMCDYCREVKSMKASVSRARKSRKEKK
jgi:DNA-directed RNA polymerase subunit RPC12/RpoP